MSFARLKSYQRAAVLPAAWTLAGALAGVIAAAVAIPIFALGQGGSGGGLTIEGNAVAEIDPHSNEVVGQVPVGARPESIAYGSGSLWVANLDDQSVSRIDPATRAVKRSVPVEETPTGLATSPRRRMGGRLESHKPFGDCETYRPAVRHVAEQDPDRQRRARRARIGGDAGRCRLGGALFGAPLPGEPAERPSRAANRSECRADRGRHRRRMPCGSPTATPTR